LPYFYVLVRQKAQGIAHDPQPDRSLTDHHVFEKGQQAISDRGTM
jgi:hypothetical protein